MPAGPTDTGTDWPEFFRAGKDLGDHLAQTWLHARVTAPVLNTDSQAPPQTFWGLENSIFNKLPADSAAANCVCSSALGNN